MFPVHRTHQRRAVRCRHSCRRCRGACLAAASNAAAAAWAASGSSKMASAARDLRRADRWRMTQVLERGRCPRGRMVRWRTREVQAGARAQGRSRRQSDRRRRSAEEMTGMPTLRAGDRAVAVTKGMARAKARCGLARHRSRDRAGRVRRVMGPSGSGKSTCMNILGCPTRDLRHLSFLGVPSAR